MGTCVPIPYASPHALVQVESSRHTGSRVQETDLAVDVDAVQPVELEALGSPLLVVYDFQICSDLLVLDVHDGQSIFLMTRSWPI